MMILSQWPAPAARGGGQKAPSPRLEANHTLSTCHTDTLPRRCYILSYGLARAARIVGLHAMVDQRRRRAGGKEVPTQKYRRGRMIA